MKTNLFTFKRPGICLKDHENLHGNKCGQSFQSIVNFFYGKKMLVLLVCICFSLMVNAQVSKFLEATPGSLSSALTTTELSTVNNLTLTGSIDARDFKTMRDNMPLLAVLDLGGVTIVAYNGNEGTNQLFQYYPADTIPNNALYNSNTQQGKTSLISVVLPSSVTSIGHGAFSGCSRLTTVKIPSSVTSIGNHAFSDCSKLITVKIPSSVTSIGNHAFSNCSKLITVKIPSSVTSIGDGAFNHSSGLILVDTNNPNYSDIDGVLYNKDQTILIQCPTSKIGSFTIPSSVTSIGAYAFLACSRLTSITTSRITPLDLSASPYVFSMINPDCILNVPNGSKSAYQAANQWNNFRIIVEKDLTGIDPFFNNQQLTIYPNPTTGKVKLAFDRMPGKGTYLMVLDVTGRTVLKQAIQNKEQWMDMKGNPPGIYLIKTNLRDEKVQGIILK